MIMSWVVTNILGSRTGVILLAAGAAVVAGLLFLARMRATAYAAGEAAVQLHQLKDVNDAKDRVAAAAACFRGDRAAVADSLRKHGF